MKKICNKKLKKKRITENKMKKEKKPIFVVI